MSKTGCSVGRNLMVMCLLCIFYVCTGLHNTTVLIKWSLAKALFILTLLGASDIKAELAKLPQTDTDSNAKKYRIIEKQAMQ